MRSETSRLIKKTAKMLLPDHWQRLYRQLKRDYAQGSHQDKRAILAQAREV